MRARLGGDWFVAIAGVQSAYASHQTHIDQGWSGGVENRTNRLRSGPSPLALCGMPGRPMVLPFLLTTGPFLNLSQFADAFCRLREPRKNRS